MSLVIKSVEPANEYVGPHVIVEGTIVSPISRTRMDENGDRVALVNTNSKGEHTPYCRFTVEFPLSDGSNLSFTGTSYDLDVEQGQVRDFRLVEGMDRNDEPTVACQALLKPNDNRNETALTHLRNALASAGSLAEQG